MSASDAVASLPPEVQGHLRRLAALPLESEPELHAQVADRLGELRDALRFAADRPTLTWARAIGSAVFALLLAMDALDDEVAVRSIQAAARFVSRADAAGSLEAELARSARVVNALAASLGRHDLSLATSAAAHRTPLRS